MPTIPTEPPSQFSAGETVQFTQPIGTDYPVADGWVLKWGLAGATQASVTATQSGSDWLVELTSAANTLTPGTYTYVLWVERTTPSVQKFELTRGIVEVQANPFAATAGDQQLTDEAELALLNTAIAARLAGDVSKYAIGDRSLEKIPLNELISWRNTVRSRLARRRRGGAFSQVRVSFGRAS